MDDKVILKNDGRFKKGNVPMCPFKKGEPSKNGLKGNKMPEEWKAKLRKPHKTTHHWTNKEKKEQSDRFKGKRMGAESSRWKGGISALEQCRIRRERMRNAEGSHTNGEWELLKIQYGFTCPCCKQKEPQIKLTEDHIVPIAKGGSNFIENIQPLCFRCNVKKHTKIIKY